MIQAAVWEEEMMDYKIIVDSCGELTEEMKKSGLFESAALSMEVGGEHIIDDATFDQASFLKRLRRQASVRSRLVRLRRHT